MVMRVLCFKHGKPGVMMMAEGKGTVLESWVPESLRTRYASGVRRWYRQLFRHLSPHAKP